jgi:prevent-host-death family protein
MNRRVSATQARVHFGEILRLVNEEGATIVVERGGRAAAVILPMTDYERLGSEAQSRNWQARITALHSLWKGELAGRELPDAVTVLREGREKRDDQLDELLRR